MRDNFMSNMVEKFSGMVNSIVVGFQKQLKQLGQEKQTDEHSSPAASAAKDDDEDTDELDIFNLIHQKEQEEKEQLAQATYQEKEQAMLTQLRHNLHTKCKKQFVHYIGFCESKINGNWVAIILKFTSKTYLSKCNKLDHDTMTKIKKDCAKGNYHAVSKYFNILVGGSITSKGLPMYVPQGNTMGIEANN